jgi:hypothetical protein
MIRIMCVGPARLYEAMASLSFDYRIKTPISRTVIFTPYSRTDVENALLEFDIDYSKFTILPDTYFSDIYDLSRWTHDNWYKQQALKLCALDSFESEEFLIQDADLLLLKDYDAFIDGKPNFKAEALWNDYHTVYADCVYGILGLTRGIELSLVNELMPYRKQDWISLKLYIEDRYSKSWLDVMPDYRVFDDTKWFSEYELLGIWKTNQTGWNYFDWVSQPPINSWEDVLNTNWNEFSAVKFHVRPLKFMTAQQAKDLVKYIHDTVN